ncbi:hypothetical protein BCR37DRAFT_381121 [Protomyces lactucae-debilis]|uniref:Uncharacterized protein n=1 Tax=Protomyces lactucae-debilis TaxID=2754530 RepID=A0A1Y2F9Y9_PROLT|nr:uncharacterized protein BCR37DRAFT_381121 [Protomyces lactucae-debilis]ORY80447.1 hypothetical protein BCR37DRAFT_381121 [Protomyces lactucae-debilis]
MVQAILDQKYTADVSSTSCNIVDVKTRWEENWKTQHHGKLSLEVRGNPGNKTNCADDDDKDVDS